MAACAVRLSTVLTITLTQDTTQGDETAQCPRLACTLSAWPGEATGIALGVAALSALWRFSFLSCLCLWLDLSCRCCDRNSAWNLLKLCTLSLLSCTTNLATMTLHSAVVHCLHIQHASIIYWHLCLSWWQLQNSRRDWSSSLPCLTLIMVSMLMLHTCLAAKH